MQLADVPLGIASLSQASGPSAEGTTITLRGSVFQSSTGGHSRSKASQRNFQTHEPLSLTTPGVTAGPQQLLITSPDGETVSLDAGFLAQQLRLTIVSLRSSNSCAPSGNHTVRFFGATPSLRNEK